MPAGGSRRLPLLPFERQLIQIIGCTEEEYRRFAQEAEFRSRLRPASYEHIPDIRCDPLTISIISLAIGLASTAASYFLAPRPKTPGEGPTSRQLSSRTGSDRFAQSFGLGTQAELADYNSPIPIVFGRYVQHSETESSGGMLVSPLLVWSRAFSYGREQGIKLLFVVGEAGPGEGIQPPFLPAIFLGSTPLDAIYNHTFAFYWKRNTQVLTRIQTPNFRYGSRATRDSGDPQVYNDIFLCPTRASDTDTGFCHSYSPASNNVFGAYASIANGTDYRVNFVLKPIPVIDDQPDDRGHQQMLERIKIAGIYGINPNGVYIKTEDNWRALRARGQGGVGRGYSCRMALISFNGQEVSGRWNEFSASIGSRVVFGISPSDLPADTYKREYEGEMVGPDVQDINNELQALRRIADDTLQLGETILIGATVWVVESRSREIYDGTSRQNITLRCVELLGSGREVRVGVHNVSTIREWFIGDNRTPHTVGPNYYNLQKVSFGLIKNTRICDVTEFGIKSQVWNRANGLCNFNNLPSARNFARAEQDKIAIQSGTMSLYMRRISVFSIQVRPITQADAPDWATINEQFGIIGEAPVDLFNFIRIKHPETAQYEFRFIPRPGTYVIQHMANDEEIWILNSRYDSPLSNSYGTPYGAFEIFASGYRATQRSIRFNPEMMVSVNASEQGTLRYEPTSIAQTTFLPEPDLTENHPLRVTYNLVDSDVIPTSTTRLEGRYGCFLYEVFGQPQFFGQQRLVTRRFQLPDGRTITLDINAVVDTRNPADHYTGRNGSGNYQAYRWSLVSMYVSSAVGNFTTNERIPLQIPASPSNPWRTRLNPPGLNDPTGLYVRVDGIVRNRMPGRRRSFEYEFYNGDPTGVGQTRSRDYETTVRGRRIRFIGNTVSIAASEEDLRAYPGRRFRWGDTTWTVPEFSSSGNWTANETFEVTIPVSEGNPYRAVGQTSGVAFVVTGIRSRTVDIEVDADRSFEANSAAADLSHYRGLLQKSNESGPEHEIVYVNEMRSNPSPPEYRDLTLAGLSLKASNAFNSVDQLRFWLDAGIRIRRFHPNDTGDGPSNQFCDLIYYLLTDRVAGAGATVSTDLIDNSNFPQLARFHDTYRMYFNGIIQQPTNLRQFMADIAPFFLCNLVIKEGRFGLAPALPLTVSGQISNTVSISQLFTAGNIIEDSFSVEFFTAEERKNFQAAMRFRSEKRNQIPEEKTVVVRWTEEGSNAYSVEYFDMTSYCTTRQHAITVAKYLLSVRRRVTHSIRFKTTPYGLNLSPGDYIRVNTIASPYQPANNGAISATGEVTSATPLADGTYSIIYYISPNADTTTGTMTVSNGTVVETALRGAIFTLSTPIENSDVYMIEQLTIGEDGLVEISATEFPVLPNTTNSRISNDVLTGQYTIE